MVDTVNRKQCLRPRCPGAVRDEGRYCCGACRSIHNMGKRIRNASFLNERNGRDQSVVDAKWDALQKVHEAMNEFRRFYA